MHPLSPKVPKPVRPQFVSGPRGSGPYVAIDRNLFVTPKLVCGYSEVSPRRFDKSTSTLAPAAAIFEFAIGRRFNQPTKIIRQRGRDSGFDKIDFPERRGISNCEQW